MGNQNRLAVVRCFRQLGGARTPRQQELVNDLRCSKVLHPTCVWTHTLSKIVARGEIITQNYRLQLLTCSSRYDGFEDNRPMNSPIHPAQLH